MALHVPHLEQLTTKLVAFSSCASAQFGSVLRLISESVPSNEVPLLGYWLVEFNSAYVPGAERSGAFTVYRGALT